jgi:DNA-binding transcriptional MocR family regulator
MTFPSNLVIRCHEQIAEQINAGIRGGSPVPGQRPPTERELGETLGVSHGGVRKAPKVRAALGLVECGQGSGNDIRHDPFSSITRVFTLSCHRFIGGVADGSCPAMTVRAVKERQSRSASSSGPSSARSSPPANTTSGLPKRSRPGTPKPPRRWASTAFPPGIR